MTGRGSVDIKFIQQGQTCVLASYAIACNALGGGAIDDALPAYCKHFSLDVPAGTSAHEAYDGHFSKFYNDNRLSGYEALLLVYRCSCEPYFDAHRGRLSLEIVPVLDAIGLKKVETVLADEPALLLATTKESPGFHSHVVGRDTAGVYSRNPLHDKINSLKSISDLGVLQDGVLIRRVLAK